MSSNFPIGLDSYVNPTSTDHLGDAPVLHSNQHANINDAIENIETKIGINFSNVQTSLDYITNLLLMTQMQHPQGAYKEVTGTIRPTQIVWYTDATKTIKLVEKNISYSPTIVVLPTSIQLKLYDGSVSNVLKRTITDSITYDRVFEIQRQRTIA